MIDYSCYDEERTPVLAREELRITNGLGQIEVFGDDFDAVLRIMGHPILMHWHDCGGSIMQYLLNLSPIPSLSAELTPMYHFTTYDWFSSMSIESQIIPALQLFTNGMYTIMVEDVDDLDLFESCIPGEEQMYPGWNGSLITTLPASRTSNSVVQNHAKRIQDGKRPCIIATGRFDVENHIFCRYVIDGHHKLQAYQQLKITPRVCSIIHHKPEPLSIELGREYSASSPWKFHYHTHKLSMKND
jgi:hypothetical protein